jgi:glycosyltransferase involved in cell wall biosynthesis
VDVYTANFENEFASMVLNDWDLKQRIHKKDAVIIYHHSIFWHEGEEIVKASRGKKYMRYHSITPHHFFKNYSTDYVNATKLGRQQTERLIENNVFDHLINTSNFNLQELKKIGVPDDRMSILAPFHKTHDFANLRINPEILEGLADDKINLLFVGRFAPNKGHKYLIETVNYYIHLYDRKIRLNIIGNVDEKLNGYYQEMIGLIKANHLDDVIFIRQNVGFEDLYTYYKASHIYLLLSEHEGFCVPILEAQYNRLPIIAWDQGAVRETLGEEQLIFKKLDFKVFATAIHQIATDHKIKEYLIEKGRQNFKKFEMEVLTRQFMAILKSNEDL